MAEVEAIGAMLEVISVYAVTIARKLEERQNHIGGSDVTGMICMEIWESENPKQVLRVSQIETSGAPSWYYYHLFEHRALGAISTD